jgi:hypothetical protein
MAVPRPIAGKVVETGRPEGLGLGARTSLHLFPCSHKIRFITESMPIQELLVATEAETFSLGLATALKARLT